MACAGEAKRPLLANLAQGEWRVQRLALPLIFNIEHQDRLAGRAMESQRVKQSCVMVAAAAACIQAPFR